MFVYIYGLICAFNIIILNEFFENKNAMYMLIIFQSITTIILLKDDENYIKKLNHKCNQLKQIIIDKQQNESDTYSSSGNDSSGNDSSSNDNSESNDKISYNDSDNKKIV
jgi:hypothetical protein